MRSLRSRSLAPFVSSVIISILSVVATLGVLSYTQKVSSSAQIKTVGVQVYRDTNLTIPLIEISWGILEPGQTKSQGLWIKNTANVPIHLNLATESWQPPAASNFIALTWNYMGSAIQVGAQVYLTLTLKVNQAISGITTFSFSILITACG